MSAKKIEREIEEKVALEGAEIAGEMKQEEEEDRDEDQDPGPTRQGMLRDFRQALGMGAASAAAAAELCVECPFGYYQAAANTT